ncbi:MAG TPA: hypothetical protein VMV34_10305 [Terriglobia bacterium]|nr:hypothetical protein [Terriglobia bacterium]
MFPAKTQEGSHKTVSAGHHSPISSQALEWVWHYLQDVRKPYILDCGAVSPASVRVLAQRGAKVYVADLIAPLQQGDPVYWRRVEKKVVFCLDEFLARLPKIPAASLQLICCWHLLDLIPGDQIPGLLNFLLSFLGNDGILHCFLREPNLKAGKEGRWWLESLTTLGAEGEGKGEFPYPALSNREVEKLTEGYSVKTFLTRSHRREVVVLKRGDS